MSNLFIANVVVGLFFLLLGFSHHNYKKAGISGALLVLGFFIYSILGLPSSDFPRGLAVFRIIGTVFLVVGWGLLIYCAFSFVPHIFYSHVNVKEAEFKEDSNTLHLHARSKRVYHMLTIAPCYNVNLIYNPAELTYTSMSIGGVTTGNLNYQKESSTISGYKNGTFSLEYRSTGKSIYKIVLDENVLKDAEKDPFIKHYLVGNTLMLIGQCANLSAMDKAIISDQLNEGTLESTTVATNILLKNGQRGLAEYECLAIKNWLKG